MFVGHYAVALGAKKAAPRLSLGTLVLASQLVDLIWPIFLLLGLEHVRVDPGNTRVTPLDFHDYPFTHSAAGAAFWALLIGGAYLATRRQLREALVLAAVSFSHWILDLITHRPDLPLFPGSDRYVGLGLWSSMAGTLALELGLFVVGTALYARFTAPIDRVGSWAFWSFLGTLLAFHAANLLGPPPPSPTAIAYAGNGLWLFVAWAYWLDRHRRPLTVTAPERHTTTS